MSELIEVEFRPKEGAEEDLAMRVKRRELTDCKHGATVVDAVLRVVTCRLCSATLDPLQVLLDLADNWERVAAAVKNLRLEKEMKVAEVERVKEELKRLRSQASHARAYAKKTAKRGPVELDGEEPRT